MKDAGTNIASLILLGIVGGNDERMASKEARTKTTEGRNNDERDIQGGRMENIAPFAQHRIAIVKGTRKNRGQRDLRIDDQERERKPRDGLERETRRSTGRIIRKLGM